MRVKVVLASPGSRLAKSDPGPDDAGLAPKESVIEDPLRFARRAGRQKGFRVSASIPKVEAPP